MGSDTQEIMPVIGTLWLFLDFQECLTISSNRGWFSIVVLYYVRTLSGVNIT